MLWGIISCSIPSQEGVCVFFILFPYVYIFFLDSVLCLLFLFLCGRFFVPVFCLSNSTARLLGAKKLMGEH